jgi:hypothetical protein
MAETKLKQQAVQPEFFNLSMARQALNNGNFDIWQRGVTATNILNGDYGSADRWQQYVNADGGTLPTSIVYSRQTLTSGDLPNSFYFYRVAPNGAGSSFGAGAYGITAQQIENGVRYLCGLNKKVTVTFWARSSIANKKFGIGMVLLYGSGGSPSADEFINGKSWTLTTSWTKYTHTFTTNTLVGKTFGTNGDDRLNLYLGYAWGTGTFGTVLGSPGVAETFGGAGNIDIAQVQLCAGEVALPFQPKSYGQELADCQRYYYRITGIDDSYTTLACGQNDNTQANTCVVPFPCVMRADPVPSFSSQGDFGVGVNGTVVAGTAIAENRSTRYAGRVTVSVASGLTQNAAGLIFFNNSSIAWIAWSAEL